MTEHGEALSAEDKTAIEDAIADLKGALEGDDVEAITAKTEVLAQAAQKLGEAMYKAQQEDAAAGDMGDMGGDAGGGQAGDDDSNVVDADFEEVDDDLPKDKSA
jgi:molecular chaperone DnaK